jgi:branched-chain amino acid transport system substrate-binding protein
MRRFTRIAATLAAFALLVAGCSSSKTSTAKKATVNSKLTGQAIVVGSICSCSGAQAAALSLLKDTMKAWTDWTNANDGINGHPVKMIVKDDGGDPATALRAVKELVEQDHVMAIVGESSLVDATWASYAEKAGVPVVGGISLESPFLTSPDFFASGTSVPVMVIGQFIAMQKQGLKHYGVMYCAESPVCAQLGQLGTLASQLTGGTITSQATTVSATAANYNAQCLAMKNGGVDGLEVGSNSTVVTRVADACAKLGYKPKMINESPTFAQDWLTNPNLDGAVLVSPNANYLDPAIPGVKDFLSALSTYAPDVQKSPQFSYDNIFPWAGGQLFAAAAKAANLDSTSKPADVKKGLYALKNETLDGVAPPLNYTAGQPALITCWFNTEVKDGKLVTTDGGKPSCLTAAQTTGLATALKALG